MLEARGHVEQLPLNRAPVAVIGRGLMGLTTAYEALRGGHPVTVYFASKNTVSDVAGASFKLHKVGPIDGIAPLLQDTWDEYLLHEDKPGEIPKTGVRQGRHMVSSNDPIDESGENMEHLQVAGLRETILRYGGVEDRTGYKIPGGDKYGLEFTTFHVNPHLFVPYLVGEIRRMGGVFVQREFGSETQFADLPEKIVVNCTGLGAATLSGANVIPLRGQIEKVMYPLDKLLAALGKTPSGEQLMSISGSKGYIYPHIEESDGAGNVEVKLGGTAEKNGSTIPDEATRRKLREGAEQILPDLPDGVAEVGLRPYSEDGPSIGFSKVIADTVVYDNFGHGGSGYTLCWGSARRVLREIDAEDKI